MPLENLGGEPKILKKTNDFLYVQSNIKETTLK